MLWSELLELVEHSWAEDIDASDAFAKKEYLKFEAALKGEEASRRIKFFEYDDGIGGTDIALTSGNIFVDCPVGLLEIKKVRYETTAFLYQLDAMPEDAVYPSGNPTHFFVQGDKIGLWPKPSSAGKYIYVWYYRILPAYAFRITESNSDSTAATFTATASAFSFTITGGANAGTQSIDITSASYNTITELVAKINSLSKGVTAAIYETCPPGHNCNRLEIVSAVSMKGTTKRVYFNLAQMPDEMIRPVLGEWMLGKAREKDRMYDQAQVHFATCDRNIEYYRRTWPNRKMSAHARAMKNVTGCQTGGVPLGPYGSVIIP